MARYAIGDVQGCWDSLAALVGVLEAGAGDSFWLVGDLVNRGPKSAEVLRWARALGERCVTVLGNHDLHLLAMAAGVRTAKKRDTAQDVLKEPDAAELIDWLRHRPLAHREGGHLLVHAGIWPGWTSEDALGAAAEIEDRLRSDSWRTAIADLYDSEPTTEWRPDLRGPARARALVAVLCRMRCLRADGDGPVMDHAFVGPAAEAGPALTPWFDWAGAGCEDRIVFGHWAALGLLRRPGFLALDTGCVWGQELTCVRLEDDRIAAVRAREGTA